MSSAQGKPLQVNFAKIKVEPSVESKEEPDKCSICWSEPPINAVQMDCNHVFCYLCIKSVASATGCCPLCRSEINVSFDFGEVKLVGDAKLPEGSKDGFFWFYKGRKGWWLYDADTTRELEAAFEAGKKRVERLIAGHVYVMSLKRLKQYRKDDELKTRQICREKLDLNDILGLAGMRNERLLDCLRQRQQALESTDFIF